MVIGLLLSAFFISGCGTTMGNLGHTIETKVILSQANFAVVGSAKGSATASYLFGFGPSQAELYGKARSKMVLNANLSEGNKSRALINVTTDIKRKMVLFYISKTVYLSADIVEFQ